MFHTPDGLEENAIVNTMWQSYVAECRELLGERLEFLKASIETTGLVQACISSPSNRDLGECPRRFPGLAAGLERTELLPGELDAI